MNSWFFTGTLGRKFGHTRGKDKQGNLFSWGKLWIMVNMDAISFPDMDISKSVSLRNTLFVNVSMSYDDKPQGVASRKLLNDLESKNYSFITVHEAVVTDIKRRALTSDGKTYEDVIQTGIRAKPNKIRLHQHRPDDLNEGIVVGKVIKQIGNQIIVEDKTRAPNGEVSSRNVPLVLPRNVSLLNSWCYFRAELSSHSPSGEEKVCGNVLTIGKLD